MPKGGWFWLCAFVAGVVLPFVYGSDYFLNVCVLFGIYVAVNLMWTLVIGTAGIISLATLAIVGASAYAAAYLGVRQGWSWPATMASAAAAGGVAGLIVAAPAMRLRGIYFALLTLGLVELARTFAAQSEALGQAEGLYGLNGFIPDRLFGTRGGTLIGYYAALALIVAALVVFRLVDGGRLGLLLRTARESEPVANALGIDMVRARLGVFLISSATLGLAGGFYAAFYRAVAPTIFSFDLLLLLLAMMVVGGIGSARGVVLGTALLLFIDQHFLEAGAKRVIASGALMFLVTLCTNRGLVGIPDQLRALLRAREAARSAGHRGGAPAEDADRSVDPSSTRGERILDRVSRR